jgi:hypothetical protein
VFIWSTISVLNFTAVEQYSQWVNINTESVCNVEEKLFLKYTYAVRLNEIQGNSSSNTIPLVQYFPRDSDLPNTRVCEVKWCHNLEDYSMDWIIFGIFVKVDGWLITAQILLYWVCPHFVSVFILDILMIWLQVQ